MPFIKRDLEKNIYELYRDDICNTIMYVYSNNNSDVETKQFPINRNMNCDLFIQQNTGSMNNLQFHMKL